MKWDEDEDEDEDEEDDFAATSALPQMLGESCA
jgi:hypothetical protein